MKRKPLIILSAAMSCLLAAGCSSLPRDHARVSSTTVFSTEGEHVWRLCIETKGSQHFRLEGHQFALHGDTARTGSRIHGLCQANVWLVGSQIACEQHNCVKMVVQGCGNTIVDTRKVAPTDTLDGFLSVTLPAAPVTHPLNTPLTIGVVTAKNLSLIVGPTARSQEAPR